MHCSAIASWSSARHFYHRLNTLWLLFLSNWKMKHFSELYLIYNTISITPSCLRYMWLYKNNIKINYSTSFTSYRSPLEHRESVNYPKYFTNYITPLLNHLTFLPTIISKHCKKQDAQLYLCMQVIKWYTPTLKVSPLLEYIPIFFLFK